VAVALLSPWYSLFPRPVRFSVGRPAMIPKEMSQPPARSWPPSGMGENHSAVLYSYGIFYSLSTLFFFFHIRDDF
jgi:hypothetical protein